MRSSAILEAGASALLLLAFAPATGCAAATAGVATTPVAAARMRDPFAGVGYDPAHVRFEAAPADLSTRCPDLANDRYDQQLWVYAAAPDGADRVMVVAGRFIPKRAGDTPVDNSVGAVMRLGPAGCTLISPAVDPFAMPDALDGTLARPAIDALARDAARRYAAAFGPGGLARAMRAAGKRAAALPPGLRPAFQARGLLPR